jgi:hypothetical protein
VQRSKLTKIVLSWVRVRDSSETHGFAKVGSERLLIEIRALRWSGIHLNPPGICHRFNDHR